MSTYRIPRIPAVELFPTVEGGRLPAKATVGEPFPIRATTFREGHDTMAAEAVLLTPEGTVFSRSLMVDIAQGLDRYEAWVCADSPGQWHFRVDTYSTPYATWAHDATIKINAGIDVELMLEEGARLCERAIVGKALANDTQVAPPAQARQVLQQTAQALRDTTQTAQSRLSAGLSSQVKRIFTEYPLRDLLESTDTYPLEVTREKALVGAWYEIFPRSYGAFQNPDGTWVSGTLRAAALDLPRIAAMGFNVIYLTPIHPIGLTNRKGKNASLTAEEGEPGSPYGIGSDHGGHDAIHPDLGTFDDFDYFVTQAREHNLEVALDIALQASPDHPWVADHPEWFNVRADGTIAYAENPPKKYQDIYPLNFDTDPQGLGEAIRDVLQLWIDHGVTLFRVDNPHTKPLNFWQETLAYFNERHPEVVFLAEAFTRPAMMRTLGAIGFDQSYTYFTWRTTKEEIEAYVTEVSQETAHLMRPAFWPTTHDILTPQMWHGGAAIFHIRAMLAALTSPTWGIYSGYECLENDNRPGFEEQNNNEKYEYRPRNWDASYETGIPQLFTLLNSLRAQHPALRQLHNIHFHSTNHPDIIAFSKYIDGKFTPTGEADIVLSVISLNPHDVVEGTIDLDMNVFGEGITDTSTLYLRDELDGIEYTWNAHNWVRLSPWTRLGHIMTINTTNTHNTEN